MECEFFGRCSAPLCFMDQPEKRLWYPGEQICRNPKFEDIISLQKQISKRADKSRYWTLDMIKDAKNIRKGIRGKDPDEGVAVSRNKKNVDEDTLLKQIKELESRLPNLTGVEKKHALRKRRRLILALNS